MKIDVSQIKAGLSRESSTSETVAACTRARARDALKRRRMSGDLSKKSSRHLRRPHDSPLDSDLRTAPFAGFARGSTRLGSSACEFYDVVSICRSLGVVDPFLQSVGHGAAKRLLRSSKRPLRLYARIKSLRFTRPRRRRRS